MVRFRAVLTAAAVIFVLHCAPAAAALQDQAASSDNTHALYAFTRADAHVNGPTSPVPIPGLSITLPPGSQTGPKFALITLSMPTLSLSCSCSASGAFYLAVGANRFASGEFDTYYTQTFTPMTIVAALPLTFAQQVVVAEWATGRGANLTLGPWASLSAILTATLNP